MAVSKPLPGQQIDRTAPAAQGIQSAWPFNEGGGSRINDSVVCKNATGTATAVAWGDNGALFNGSTSYVSVPNPGFLKTSKCSFLVQFRTSRNTAQQYFYDTWNYPSTGGLTIGMQATGEIFLIFDNPTQTNYFYAQTAAKFNDGKAHTAAFTYDGSVTAAGISIYVDGVKTAATASSGGTGDPGAMSTTVAAYIGKARSSSITAPLSGSSSIAALWAATLPPSLACALTSNPYQLWPDDQIVFAPATGTTGTATTSQVQTADAVGTAGVIGTATASQAQTAAATGLAGVIGTATVSQIQTADATGLAGVIGTATSSQAQTSDAIGGDIVVATGSTSQAQTSDAVGLAGAIGTASSSQAQSADATGLAGVIGTATASQAQTSDAIGIAGIVGTATSSQAQTATGAGDNGQRVSNFGHVAQPQYIHVPMFARGTGKATCKARLQVRVLNRALAIGRSKGTCRPLARQYMAGRAVGASAPIVSSVRLQYNSTWHAQRARDDQSLLLGF